MDSLLNEDLMVDIPLEILMMICLNYNVLEYIRAKQTCSYLYKMLTGPYFKANGFIKFSLMNWKEQQVSIKKCV